MMGGMLAGHDQSGGEVMEKNGRKVKTLLPVSLKKERIFRVR